MTTAIEVSGLSKFFKLYNKRVDRLKETFLPFLGNKRHHKFSALEDITFSINKGETVGIVGRNGSGKSTLLQVICGILQPSSGAVVVRGRISALLELGTGFNPEFTGRENVYLSASILGMGKEEIDLYFDDILDFADIGEFIDQPVKTYSSGMYVRLAFAVAINVKPDILIVDEALSVGDTLFQAKCFAKFQEFQKQGITILFVTHSTDLLARYCDSAILLNDGRLLTQGPAKDVIDTYNRLIVDCAREGAIHLNDEENDTDVELIVREEIARQNFSDNRPGEGDTKSDFENIDDLIGNLDGEAVQILPNPNEDRYGNGKAKIVDFGINALSGKVQQSFVHGDTYLFWVHVEFLEKIEDPIVAYTIKDIKGLTITGTNTSFKETVIGAVIPGESRLVTFEHEIRLNPGDYLLSFGCAGFQSGEYVVYDRRFDVTPFQVVHDKSTIGVFDLNSKVSVYRA